MVRQFDVWAEFVIRSALTCRPQFGDSLWRVRLLELGEALRFAKIRRRVAIVLEARELES